MEDQAMDDRLFVRVYNVGCGDCIYLRIPDEQFPRHVLIDCGNFFGDRVSYLRFAMQNLQELLNDEEQVPQERLGKLDLLVATHQHWDHIKGFEGAMETLRDIEIERIWISIAMDEQHEDAHQLRALQAHVATTLERLVERRGLRLDPKLSALFELGLSTREATKAVCQTLPEANNVSPLFVFRGVEQDLSDSQAAQQLLVSDDPSIRLHILAPEQDIDSAYMGRALPLLDSAHRAETWFGSGVAGDIEERPGNISERSFRLLRTQLFQASLFAASQENHVVNNTSVVLLLEWRGRRLLFPGDAEHESWRWMWHHNQALLDHPLDFLKISHHGSHNGTPFDLQDPQADINQILNAMLPRANAENAQAVVSTLAGRIHAPLNPVPHPSLLNELAARVSNTKENPPDPGRQPQRTDTTEEDWIDFFFSPAPEPPS
jgi:beta-lactamase superfamily II metal-dependent hydrolase